eukprot:1769419-Pleurochrysis_carterae.AAC.1
MYFKTQSPRTSVTPQRKQNSIDDKELISSKLSDLEECSKFENISQNLLNMHLEAGSLRNECVTSSSVFPKAAYRAMTKLGFRWRSSSRESGANFTLHHSMVEGRRASSNTVVE